MARSSARASPSTALLSPQLKFLERQRETYDAQTLEAFLCPIGLEDATGFLSNVGVGDLERLIQADLSMERLQEGLSRAHARKLFNYIKLRRIEDGKRRNAMKAKGIEDFLRAIELEDVLQTLRDAFGIFRLPGLVKTKLHLLTQETLEDAGIKPEKAYRLLRFIPMKKQQWEERYRKQVKEAEEEKRQNQEEKERKREERRRKHREKEENEKREHNESISIRDEADEGVPSFRDECSNALECVWSFPLPLYAVTFFMWKQYVNSDILPEHQWFVLTCWTLWT